MAPQVVPHLQWASAGVCRWVGHAPLVLPHLPQQLGVNVIIHHLGHQLMKATSFRITNTRFTQLHAFLLKFLPTPLKFKSSFLILTNVFLTQSKKILYFDTSGFSQLAIFSSL